MEANIQRPETGSSAGKTPFYRLRLFVAGSEPNSDKAKAVLANLRDKYLRGCCEINVVDVFENYQAAIDYQIVAIPTLIVESPPPQKVIVGSLSNEDTVLDALGLAGREVQL